jgi:hypothetical protein
VDLIEYFVFSWAVLLLVLGLVFEASGFGIFVAGRLDGFILIIIGVTMYWGGWILSRARSFSCALAAVLNMFDAASTVSFWNFEINPLVLAAGPTIFMVAKIACSLTIMLYAKLHTNPRRGGIVLTVVFAFIVAWNLGQHLMAYLGLKDFAYGILLGTIFSFVASAIILYTIFIHVRMKLPKQLQTHILSVW